MLILTAALLYYATVALAFPDFERCLQDTWIGGTPFNQFGVANFTSGGAADCVLSGVPQTFTPCESFTITLTSKIVLGHKVSVTGGTLANSLITTTKQKATCRHSSENKQTVTNYRWTAPPDNTQSVTFGALCGDMRVNQVMFTANQLVAVNSNTGSVFQGGCPLDANAAADPPPSDSAKQIQDNIPLLGGIGGIVVVGLGVAGFFAVRKRAKTQQVMDKIEDIGATVKQRIQSIRPPAQQMTMMNNGFTRIEEANNTQMMMYQPQQQQRGNMQQYNTGNAASPNKGMYMANPSQMQQNAQYNYSGQSQQQGMNYGYATQTSGRSGGGNEWQANGRQQQLAMQINQGQQYAYPMPGQTYQQGRSGQPYPSFSSANPTFDQQQQRYY